MSACLRVGSGIPQALPVAVFFLPIQGLHVLVLAAGAVVVVVVVVGAVEPSRRKALSLRRGPTWRCSISAVFRPAASMACRSVRSAKRAGRPTWSFRPRDRFVARRGEGPRAS